MPRSGPKGTSRLNSKSSPELLPRAREAIDPIDAVHATPHNGDGISINLTINNPGTGTLNHFPGPGEEKNESGSLADRRFGNAGAAPERTNTAGGGIVEVARSPTHKKRRGNKKAGDKNITFESEYSPVGGFDANAARAFLAKHHWPVGLQEAMIKSCKKMPVRFFITDDSGSMLTNDGNRLVGTDPRKKKLIKCTRWSELTQSLRFHAELSEIAHAPSEFRLLNNAEPVLVGKNDDQGQGMELLSDILDDSPGGQTPICAQINEVVRKIQEMDDLLRNNNQTAAVIICTDGVSTDGDVATAMKPLQHLPVWVVVRLCTDDEELIDYWNNIDEDLELDMDVLDDVKGEAIEVRTANPWLRYGECLHRLREFGASIKEMDLIDESALSSEQMAVIVSVLCGTGNVRDLPHPDVDWKAFVQEIKNTSSEDRWIYDPIDEKPATWIDLKALTSMYNSNSSTACTIS